MDSYGQTEYERTERIVDELSSRIYTALRDGGLEAELLIELACLLEEWDESSPVTRELLERPTADLTAADLPRLGKALLDETGFGPTFALEPTLLVPLEQELKIVERDVRTTGITGTLRMIVPDWDSMGGAWVEFQGICQGNGLGPGAGLARIADATQEVIMEVIWRAWPVCSTHDRGLRAEMKDEIAVWRCTAAGTHIVAPVGELPSERP
ncbi:hypothetical protein ACIBF6_29395 [Streptosporangium amethystogenes]|uniref:hypothetical protein n=1 Tax=Streptosporangium amethystogenes TaxID=2002 RepID=UPI0037BCCC0F